MRERIVATIQRFVKPLPIGLTVLGAALVYAVLTGVHDYHTLKVQAAQAASQTATLDSSAAKAGLPPVPPVYTSTGAPANPPASSASAAASGLLPSPRPGTLDDIMLGVPGFDFIPTTTVEWVLEEWTIRNLSGVPLTSLPMALLPGAADVHYVPPTYKEAALPVTSAEPAIPIQGTNRYGEPVVVVPQTIQPTPTIVNVLVVYTVPDNIEKPETWITPTDVAAGIIFNEDLPPDQLAVTGQGLIQCPQFALGSGGAWCTPLHVPIPAGTRITWTLTPGPDYPNYVSPPPLGHFGAPVDSPAPVYSPAAGFPTPVCTTRSQITVALAPPSGTTLMRASLNGVTWGPWEPVPRNSVP